jgi:hypothetical protein
MDGLSGSFGAPQGLLEDQGAAGLDLGGGAVVDGCGSVQADA